MKLHDLKTDKINTYGDNQAEILLAKGGGRWIVADMEEIKEAFNHQFNTNEMKKEEKKEMPKKATKPAAPKMPKSPKSPKPNTIKPKA